MSDLPDLDLAARCGRGDAEALAEFEARSGPVIESAATHPARARGAFRNATRCGSSMRSPHLAHRLHASAVAQSFLRSFICTSLDQWFANAFTHVER